MLFTKPLKGRYLFKVMFKKGKYISDQNITVYVLPSKEEKNFLGICVSKKHGNSVVRNKLKRWVREAYKVIEKDVRVGYNIVVLFKKNVLIKDLSYEKIKEELSNCLEKQGLYNEKSN